jgi:hypothetical protein
MDSHRLELDLHRLELRFAAGRLVEPRAVARIAHSIERCGQIVPCVVVAVPGGPGGERLVLIDGYRRVAALRRLGRDIANVERWACDVTDTLLGLLARTQDRPLASIAVQACADPGCGVPVAAEAHPPAISPAGGEATGRPLSRGGEHATGIGGASLHASELSAGDRVGVAAARQFANVEAIDQFRRGLVLVEALSDMPERAERELDLQMALGSALFATKVRSHPDIGRAYAGPGSSVGNLGITAGNSRRSAACTSTI